MPSSPLRGALPCALAVLLGACAGKSKSTHTTSTLDATDEEGLAASARNVEPMVPPRKVALIPLRIDGQHCDASGKHSDQQDLNQDGRADLITLTVTGKGGAEDGRIRCQQADLNFDGRLDGFLHYDERGELVREQYDQDFDGRIDLGRTYKDGKSEIDEQDLDHDGFIDAWRRYDKGKLVRIDHDRDHDGRADTFTFIVRGAIDRVGYDTNGDGNVDVWDQDVARRAQAALARRQQARQAVGEEEFVEAPPAPEPEKKDDKSDKGAKPDKAKKGETKDPKKDDKKAEPKKDDKKPPEPVKSDKPADVKPADTKKPADSKPPAATPATKKPADAKPPAPPPAAKDAKK